MKKALKVTVVLITFIILLSAMNRKIKNDSVAFRPEDADNLLGISQVWKSASEFYGYFELLPEDFDWDKEFEKAFHQAAEVEDGYGYYRILSQFVATLQDGHQVVASPDNRIIGSLPFSFLYIEGHYYVVSTGDQQVPLYCKLDRIEGRETQAYLDEEIGPIVGLQTPLARQQQLIFIFTKYGESGKKVSLEFLTPDGDRFTKSFVYKSGIGMLLGLNQKVQTAEVFTKPKEVLYTSDIFTLRKANQLKPIEETVLILEVKTMFLDGKEELTNRILPYIIRSQGCVIDLRPGDGGNSRNGLSVLYPFIENDVIIATPTIQSFQQIRVGYDMLMAHSLNQIPNIMGISSTARSQLEEYFGQIPPEILKRGQQMLQGRYSTGTEDELAQIIREYIKRNKGAAIEEEKDLSQWVDLPKIEVPVVVLIDHNTGSAVDDTAAYAKAWGIPLVGTRTRGATGSLVSINLANGWQVSFSGQRSITPDGLDIWNEGVVADIQADYNLEDLIKGIDTPLQTAIEFLQKQM